MLVESDLNRRLAPSEHPHGRGERERGPVGRARAGAGDDREERTGDHASVHGPGTLAYLATLVATLVAKLTKIIITKFCTCAPKISDFSQRFNYIEFCRISGKFQKKK